MGPIGTDINSNTPPTDNGNPTQYFNIDWNSGTFGICDLYLNDGYNEIRSRNHKHLVFQTDTTQDGGTNVGIGTTDPSHRLHVVAQNTSVTGSTYIKDSDNSIINDSTKVFNNIGIFTNGDIVGNQIVAHSDQRIKTNIADIPDDLALQQVRDIPCRYYEYIDKATKGTEKIIGFIAQEVKEILPMAIKQVTEFIPDEYRMLENITWEEIISEISGNTTYKMLSDLTNVSGINYKFMVSNDLSDNMVEKQIIGNSDDTFTFDVSYQYVFCYGKKVDDFHTVDKAQIFAIHHSAIQKMDKLQLEEKDKVTTLENKVKELETKNTELQTKLDNIMTILNNNNLT